MNWDLVLILNASAIATAATAVFVVVIYDLITGRYRRFRKLEEEMQEFKQEIEKRRDNILGEKSNNE